MVMTTKPLVSEDVCWHCHQRHGSQAEATRLERSYRLTSEALDQSQEDLHNALSEIERLRAALEKIANSGHVNASWLVADARKALGRES